MALSGEMNGAIQTSGYHFFVRWSASQSIENNTSSVYVQWGVRKTSYDSSDYNSAAKLTCQTGGTTHYDGIPKNWNGNNGWDMRTKSVGFEYVYYSTTVTVAHAADGTGSLYLYGQFNASNGLGHITWPTVTLSQTVTLDTIPRASQIGATDANVGAVSMVTVARKSAAYSHSIQYAFGTLSGYLTAEGDVSASEVKLTEVSVAFAVPAAFYAQIPNAKSGVCTLTCTTYSGAVQIGAAQSCTFTVTAAESVCAPAVSGAVVDANEVTRALTGDANRLVRYFSTALCTIMATAQNGASIVSQSIAGTAVSGTTRSIASVETGTFLFSAADSRGYTGSATVTKGMVDYVRLTCDGTASRTAPTADTATLNLSGNFFNASFGAAANTLTVSYMVNGGNAVAVTPVNSGNTWSASIWLSGLAYTSAHTITVTAADRLTTVTRTITLNRGVPVFDWGKDDMQIHVPLGLPGGLDAAGKRTLLDFIYPVGSYYWSANATSPDILFGGIWAQVKDRFVLAAGDAYQVNTTGGEAAHGLTIDEMPSHGKHLWPSYLEDVISDTSPGAAIGRYLPTASMAAYSSVTRGWIDWNAGEFYPSGCYMGGSAAHNNMPPYIVAYCWQRTA